MSLEHKEGCWYPKTIKDAAKWYANWPKSCNRCYGWGGFTFYDGDTGFTDVDPCPECIEKGKCPRCAGYIASEVYWDAGHYAVCANCGFVEGKTPGQSYPEHPCSCIEEEVDDYLDGIPY